MCSKLGNFLRLTYIWKDSLKLNILFFSFMEAYYHVKVMFYEAISF